MLEAHFGLLLHRSPQIAGQLKLTEAAKTTEESSAKLFQLFLLCIREHLTRLADQLAEPRPRLLGLGISRLLFRQYGEGIDVRRVDAARLEPLPGEIADELARAFVGQHSANLSGQILPQLVLGRQPK